MAVVESPPSRTENRGSSDADLLFREAKQRERRRRLLWLGGAALGVGAAAGLFFGLGQRGMPPKGPPPAHTAGEPKGGPSHLGGPSSSATANKAAISACAPFMDVTVPSTVPGSGVAVAIPSQWLIPLLHSYNPSLVQAAKAFESSRFNDPQTLRSIVAECHSLGG
jgi:hypothetical protein